MMGWIRRHKLWPRRSGPESKRVKPVKSMPSDKHQVGEDSRQIRNNGKSGDNIDTRLPIVPAMAPAAA